MWIFWISLFILSSVALIVFIKKHKSVFVTLDNPEFSSESSILLKNVIVRGIHSQVWLAIVNNIEKILRKIRILFLKFDNFVLNIIDKVRGHSSKIVQKNLENQETARENKDSDGNVSATGNNNQTAD